MRWWTSWSTRLVGSSMVARCSRASTAFCSSSCSARCWASRCARSRIVSRSTGTVSTPAQGPAVVCGCVYVRVGDHGGGSLRPDRPVITQPDVGEQIDCGYNPQGLSFFIRLDLTLRLGDGMHPGLLDGLGVGVGDQELDG